MNDVGRYQFEAIVLDHRPARTGFGPVLGDADARNAGQTNF
jgi:hypothetical protein